MVEKKLNYELIALYQQRLNVMWIFEFLPILVILGVGYKILTESLKYKSEINPLWLFYLCLIFLILGIVGSAIGIAIRFFKTFFSTRKKLKLAMEGKI